MNGFDDQELEKLLLQQRSQREDGLRALQDSQGTGLGGALATIAGGIGDAVAGGGTNYAGKASDAYRTANSDQYNRRLKALDEQDQTLKPLVDLAKLRSGESREDKRLQSADARQEKSLEAALERAKILGGSKGASLELRQDNQAAQAAGAFDKDPIISSLTKQKQQIDRDRHTLETATTLTPQIFNEIQTGIANAIAGGHVAAQGTIHDLQYKSAEIELANLKQRLTNSPQDIGSPEVKRYLSDLINRLGDAYSGNIEDRAHQVSVGRNYDHNPYAQRAVAEKLKSYARPSPSPTPAGDKKAPTGAAGPHGATVYQNGHMYSWNPETGQYE